MMRGHALRAVFFGTPEWAVPSLRALAASEHEIVGTVCPEDKAIGRSHRLQACPVKRAALDLALAPILQPPSLRPRAVREAIVGLNAEVFVVVAYGRILPGRLLDAPRHGAVNLHFSLLPRHRGASPVQHAILAGDTHSGVCTMHMERGLDTGPLLKRWETAIGAEETTAELGERLAQAGARVLVETIDGLATGTLSATPQPEEGVSWAPPLTREMGRVDWEESAEMIARKLRAFTPWPRLSALSRKGIFQLRRARVAEENATESLASGTVLRREGDALLIVCAQGTLLRLESVQPQDRREMSAAAALAGRFFQLGERLQTPPPAS